MGIHGARQRDQPNIPRAGDGMNPCELTPRTGIEKTAMIGICECGTRFPDLADDGTIWHYLALLEGYPFSISNRINELRSYPVTGGTLFVSTSLARSLTPFRTSRTTDKIVATHGPFTLSSRTFPRRWHVDSEDGRLAESAIFATFLQSSGGGSNCRDDASHRTRPDLDGTVRCSKRRGALR